MTVKITKHGRTFVADIVDLPGSPPIGKGMTSAKAVAELMFEMLHPANESFRKLINFDKFEVIFE